MTPSSLVHGGSAQSPILRFDRTQRVIHWVSAILFGVLLLSAIPLYFGSFFGAVLPRHAVEKVHLWAGLVLPVALVASFIGPWGHQMRVDARRFNYWSRDEVVWLRSAARAGRAIEKFNPGQKLNAVFLGASLLVMLGTGSVLQWFSAFSISQREGATFVHDAFALLLVIVIAGHVVMALTHREALGSMIRGTISRNWAAHHAPAWLGEVTSTHADVDSLGESDGDETSGPALRR